MFIIQITVVFVCLVPITLTEDCQPTVEKSFKSPDVPHLSLNTSFLSRFHEILVIGDVHGCYDELQLLLKKARATSNHVLKIFTGDFSRKGPKSLQALQFVNRCSSCLSVRGNNDEETLSMIHEAKRTNLKFLPWDRWMNRTTPDDIHFLEELPYTISIPSLNAIVVHAGLLPGGVPLENNRPWTLMNIRDVLPRPECEGGFSPTRKAFVTQAWASIWNGPDHVYFGHDHKRQLQLHPFATGIDTSCVRGHHMTGIFIYGSRKGKIVTQESLHIYFPGEV